MITGRLFSYYAKTRLFFAALVSIVTLQAALAEPIKIGVSLPLSGEGASYGSDYRKIYTFANERLAQNRYHLIFEDDRCSGKDALTAAQKLINIDQVRFVLGVTCDAVFASAGATYERSGVVVISTSGSFVPGANLFHTELSSRSWAEPLHSYLAPRHKKIGLLVEETVFATNFARNLVELDRDHALKFLRESFLSNEENLKPQLLRLKQADPDAIVIVPQTENSLYRVIKQLHEINWTGPRYSTFFPGAKAFLDQAGALANGIVYSDFPDLKDVLSRDGRELYRQYIELNGEPASGAGLFVGALEAFRALDQAIQSGRRPSEYLRAATFEGVLGPWRFNSDGFWNGYHHIVKVIRDGKPAPMSE